MCFTSLEGGLRSGVLELSGDWASDPCSAKQAGSTFLSFYFNILNVKYLRHEAKHRQVCFKCMWPHILAKWRYLRLFQFIPYNFEFLVIEPDFFSLPNLIFLIKSLIDSYFSTAASSLLWFNFPNVSTMKLKAVLCLSRCIAKSA